MSVKDRLDFVSDLRKLAAGKHVPGISTTKEGYRRVSSEWLGMVADRMELLEQTLVAVNQTLEELAKEFQVSEEMNWDRIWDEVRKAAREV